MIIIVIFIKRKLNSRPLLLFLITIVYKSGSGGMEPFSISLIIERILNAEGLASLLINSVTLSQIIC